MRQVVGADDDDRNVDLPDQRHSDLRSEASAQRAWYGVHLKMSLCALRFERRRQTPTDGVSRPIGALAEGDGVPEKNQREQD